MPKSHGIYQCLPKLSYPIQYYALYSGPPIYLQMTTIDIQPVIDVLNRFHPLDKGPEQYLKKHMTIFSVKRGKLLLKSGEICNNMYFIKKGVLRGFIKEGQKDITTWITVENEIVAAISSYIFQVPTVENIQAIEDCELFSISFADLENLYKKYPSFNIMGRKIAEIYYTYAENRAFITRLRNAENKYRIFLQLYSHLSNRVSLKYIASFLGMTIETLSRVRKKTFARTEKL